MSEIENSIGVQLKSLAPTVPVEPDWTNVMARASVVERRQLRKSRRRLGLLLAAAIMIVVLVVPPIGLGGKLFDFLGLSAPPALRGVIRTESEPRRSVVKWLQGQAPPGLDTDSIHGVIQVDTAQGPIRLWGAASKDGTTRYRFIQMPTADTPGSRPSSDPTGIFTGLGTGPTKLDAGVEIHDNYPVLQHPLLHGQVLAPVTSVRVRYPDGRSQKIPLVEGYMLSELNHASGSAVVEALDSSGVVVGRQDVSLVPYKAPVVTEIRRLMDVDFPNGTASLFVKPAPHDPKRCYRVVATNGSSGSCGTDQGSVGYGVQQVGDVNPTLLLMGAVADDVTRLRVKLPSGWKAIDLKEGYFLIPLSKEQRPDAFEATHRNGTKELIPIRF